MGKTSITILEETVASAAVATGGGEIATVLKADRGRADKVYTLTTTTELKRIYGTSTGLDYKYCKYLLTRGNVLRVIRAAFTGGTAAAATLPFSASTAADAPGLVCTGLTAGTGYNNIKVTVTNQGGTGKDNVFSLVVYDNDATVLETFSVVSLNPESEYFYGKVVKSDVISLALTEGQTYTDQTLFSENVSEKTVTLAGGTAVTDTASYVEPLSYLANKEISFATLILPTCTPANAGTYAKTLVNTRKDFLLIIDPEEGSQNYADAAALAAILAGLKPAMEKPEDASYVASYFPRGVMAEFADTVPPSVVIADLIAQLHTRKLWFKAPAGLEYGLLNNLIDVARDLTAKEIGDIQEAGVNPIVTKTGTGIVVWGQSTEAASALLIRRLAVRLLVNYLKRSVYALSQRFIFADHNELTWNQWKNTVEPIIRDIANVNGLRAYKVVCDRSIMTAEDIANGIMRGLIVIWPNSQIEQIEVKFTIDNTGVSFE